MECIVGINSKNGFQNEKQRINGPFYSVFWPIDHVAENSVVYMDCGTKCLYVNMIILRAILQSKYKFLEGIIMGNR